MNRPSLFAVTVALLLVIGCKESSPDDNPLSVEGPTLEVVDGEIVIPQSAIAALAGGYSFSVDLDIDSPENDLAVQLDGVQAGDSTRGTLNLGGTYGEAFDDWRSSEMEIVVIGERIWWRELGGEWQPGFEPGGDSDDPLLTLIQYATPSFYLDALRFEALALPLSGSMEDVNGVSTLPVRLDKQGVLDVMEQGSEIKRYPDVWDEHSPIFPGLSENAQQVLPSDFLIELWFAESGGYPARIVFSYSIDEGESCALCWAFNSPMSLHLQMDITDTTADVDIQPPIPIPTEVPTPTAPPGELTGSQGGRITEIVISDPRVQALMSGGSVGIAYEAWYKSDLTILGGYAYVDFREPKSFEGTLPSIVYDESETTDPPFIEVETNAKMDRVGRLRVLVYLPEERVVQIELVGAATPRPTRTPIP